MNICHKRCLNGKKQTRKDNFISHWGNASKPQCHTLPPIRVTEREWAAMLRATPWEAVFTWEVSTEQDVQTTPRHMSHRNDQLDLPKYVQST